MPVAPPPIRHLLGDPWADYDADAVRFAPPDDVAFAGGDEQIYQATRSDRGTAFGAAIQIADLNTSDDEGTPSGGTVWSLERPSTAK